MPDLLDPRVQRFRQEVLDDSGLCCRKLLGWNYDEDEKTGEKFNVGTGGVRPDGPHKRMTEFLDGTSKRFKLMLAPRGSYKSTILQGYCVRKILRNPNIRILYGMKDEGKAKDKSAAIRKSLERQHVTELFGRQIPEVSDVTGWTVLTRTQTNLQEPTFSIFTTDAAATGGHFDVIICDDLIDEDWCSPDKMLKAKRALRQIFPLLKQGGILIVVGTRYDDDDIYNELLQNKNYDILVYDSGDDIRIEQKPDGSFHVVGTPRFPHQSLTYLNDALGHMKPRSFMSQYMNVIANDLRDQFTRELFQSIQWRDDMQLLSGYILTDTAGIGGSDKGDYWVLAYVGIDASHTIYLLDLKVGRWHLDEFLNFFFDLRSHWDQKLNHAGETFEVNQASQIVMGTLKREAALRQVKLNLIEINRGAGMRSKEQRIQNLQPAMKERRFFVANTVPKTFIAPDGEKLLWDPVGYYDDRTQAWLPAGELVDEFIRFPLYSKRDIADAIADIESTDSRRGYARFCTYKNPRAKNKWSLAGMRDDATFRVLNPPQGSVSQDFWERLAEQNNIQR